MSWIYQFTGNENLLLQIEIYSFLLLKLNLNEVFGLRKLEMYLWRTWLVTQSKR